MFLNQRLHVLLLVQVFATVQMRSIASHVCVCVHVCEKEGGERESERERAQHCVCVCVCVCVLAYVREGDTVTQPRLVCKHI